jgi:DNA helicase-2/ATP-dependent DNA helicase PcrA
VDSAGANTVNEHQRQVIDHGLGPLLVIGGAGRGRSEAIARRLVRLADSGTAPESVLILAETEIAARTLRERVEELLDRPFEDLWIFHYQAAAERLLREYSVEAGLDPFFQTLGRADRLAILLDCVDELPLRRHEIRGNPAGLLARLLNRIDALKAERVFARELRDWASAAEKDAGDRATREAAKREIEFAELYATHDRLLSESGSLDSGDLILELGRLLHSREDVRERIAERFTYVMADEYEDAGAARQGLLEALASHGNLLVACDPMQAIRRYRGAAGAAVDGFRSRHIGLAEIELTVEIRGGGEARTAASALAELVPAELHCGSLEAGPGQSGPTQNGRAAGPEDEQGHSEGGDGERDGADGAAEQTEPGELDPDATPGCRVTFWRCGNERAQAQAVAREIEHLLAAGEVRPEQVCVVTEPAGREGRLVAAALEERSVPFQPAGSAAFFQRTEVRDVIAGRRLLANPGDAPAVVRALTRPPVELRSVDVARCTMIARRRKLDMVSALEAALESPQLPPESRDRIREFLKTYRSAGAAMEEMRADVFVRRLIERIGLRRQRLFAATPETAERLVNLARLAELAAAWARREPRGSTRDFVRYLNAVAEAGERFDDAATGQVHGGVLLAAATQIKGREFDYVYLLGLHQDAFRGTPGVDAWIPDELVDDELPPPGKPATEARRARLAYTAVTRARRAVVLARPEVTASGEVGPSPVYEHLLAALGDADAEEFHEEELFGPAEGLHSTYRMLRDEVLETSWRAGAALSEMRLDTAEDVNRAVARFLELLKLSAMIQRPSGERPAESLSAFNEQLARMATSEQRAAFEASALDDYVLGEEHDRDLRRELVAARDEPTLEAFIPTRGDGLALSASDLGLYMTCPLKYKFARVFAIPQEPTINQRFGILVHQVLERFHAEKLRDEGGGLDRLLSLFEAGWRRTGFGSSDDELQYRDRAVAALARYEERDATADAQPVWLERQFNFEIGDHKLRGRVDRIDRLPGGGYELIDYKTGELKTEADHADDLQLALYRLGARVAWDLEVEAGTYWYVLDDSRVELPAAPDDRERVERTVLEVGEGIRAQDFEPRPDYAICSWCDYRLICPASEA